MGEDIAKLKKSVQNISKVIGKKTAPSLPKPEKEKPKPP